MALRFLTAGESHGKALVGILEGLPAGLAVTRGYIRGQLARRRLGFGRSGRQRIEDDAVEILSGVRGARTLGSPVALLIPNQSRHAGDGPPLLVPRPGHADLAGALKYGSRDLRDIQERASARETAMRVALGSLARRLLEECGVFLASRVLSIGRVRDARAPDVPFESMSETADASPVRCLDAAAGRRMVRALEAARRKGDSLGGTFEVSAARLPVGLGSHVHWDRRLEARIAAAFMSLNAVKGAEIGLGFAAAAKPGSQAHDEIFPGLARRTNRSGGIEGGTTTGRPVVVRAAMKPIPTLAKPLRSVHLETGRAARARVQRADVCAVPAAAVVGESLLALVLADAMLEKFGGDSADELRSRLRVWNSAHPAGRAPSE